MIKSAPVVLVNYPHHRVQQGHNEQGIFADNDKHLFSQNWLSTRLEVIFETVII